jgi:predicted phosphodiesterase
MKMAVFSDSHGNIALLEQAVRYALKSGAEVLVHLGDFYADLGELDCGSAVTHRVPGLPGTDAHNPFVEAEARFAFAGWDIVAVHDREKRTLQNAALILYGHTHKADCSPGDDGLWYLNPGHLKARDDRGEKASFALITACPENALACAFHSPEGAVLSSCTLRMNIR